MHDLLTHGDRVADLLMPIPLLPVRAGVHPIAPDFLLEPGAGAG